MKKFSSGLDQVASLVPYFMVALSLVILVTGWWSYKKGSLDQVMLYVAIVPVTLLLAGTVIAMYYLQPVAVAVDMDAVAVERKAGRVFIPFADIRSVRAVDAADMKHTIRTFGNGGVFGYTGAYYNRKMGSMTWYCTQRRNYVLIETVKKKIVVTPDDPQGLLMALKPVLPAGVVN